MIQLYYWPTPNGHKASIMLEELEIPYELHAINILKGEQFDENFVRISPNNRIPAIVDSIGPDGVPYSVFESGAILMYLAEKTGRLWPEDLGTRYTVVQWLMFQMGNVGPIFGQNGYFQGYCPEDVPLAKSRYHNMTMQLYGVLDRRLAEHEYLAGAEYSIADVATYPWTVPKQRAMHRIDIEQFPHVKRWGELLAARPGVQRGLALLAEDQRVGNPTAEGYDNLFGAKQYR